MWRPEREVFVHLIRDDQRVVLVRELDNQLQSLPGKYRAGRVVRIVHDDQSGAIGHGGAQGVEVGLEVGSTQRNRSMDAATQADQSAVGIVERLEGHDLVTRFDQRQNGRRKRLGCAGRDQNLTAGVELQPVEPLLVPGNRLEEDRLAAPRRILVHPVADRLAGGLENLGWSVFIRKALSEIDGTGARGERAHLGEYTRCNAAVFREEPGPAGCASPGTRDDRGMFCVERVLHGLQTIASARSRLDH